MELFLFTTDSDLALRAEQAGIDSIIVDWETNGKDKRQKEFDLETNNDTPGDVYKLSKILKIPVTVRVNCLGKYTPVEVECALENGAKILMLPVARSVEGVKKFLNIVHGRAKTIIQVETPQLASKTDELAKLNWDYVYIGLNDLMVAKGSTSIWEAVIDGTVEYICNALKGKAYGFGGVTVLGGGNPISIELLIHEYIRLKCNLSFLRRTFKREFLDRDIEAEIRAIHAFIESSLMRGPLAKAHDYQRLCQAIKGSIKKEYLKVGVGDKQKYFINV